MRPPTRGFFRMMQLVAFHLRDDAAAWEWFIKGLPPRVRARIDREWEWQAHPGQLPPDWEPGPL